jgi:hypothetical protein
VLPDVLTVHARDTRAPVLGELPDRRVVAGEAFELWAPTVDDDDPNIMTTGRLEWSLSSPTGVERAAVGPNISMSLDEEGAWQGNFTVTDTWGHAAHARFTLFIADGVAPTAAALAPSTATVGRPVRLDATPSRDNGEGLAFLWTFEGPSGAGSLEGAVANVSFSAPGSHRIALSVTDASGNTDNLSFVIEVTQPPAAGAPEGGPGGAAAAVAAALALAAPPAALAARRWIRRQRRGAAGPAGSRAASFGEGPPEGPEHP